MYHEAKHAFSNHGIKLSSVEVDLPAMLVQKDNAVKNMTRGIESLFKKNKVTYVEEYGVKSLPDITIHEKKIVLSTRACSLSKVPKKLIVIGARYIGLEMGFVCGRLGSEVVEFAAYIVHSMRLDFCFFVSLCYSLLIAQELLNAYFKELGVEQSWKHLFYLFIATMDGQ